MHDSSMMGGDGGYSGGGGGPGFANRRRPRGGGYNDTEWQAVPRSIFPGQRPVDTFSSMIHYVNTRFQHHRTPYFYQSIPSHEYYAKDVLPVQNTAFNPSTALCIQCANRSQHPDSYQRSRIPFHGIQWSPHGNRLLCSTSRGEFLLFNGKSFGAEVKTLAHEDGKACRALAWGPRTDIILSGSETGAIKLWLPNLAVIAEADSHHRAVKELTWCPTEAKFASCGLDGSVRVWDLATVGAAEASRAGSGSGGGGGEESRLEGHGGEVTTCAWHPSQALIATGAQDTQCRLWDPRVAATAGGGGSLLTLQGHSKSVSAVRWHPTRSHQLLTAGQDAGLLLWDTRYPQAEVLRLNGHTASITQAAWHPLCEDLLATADSIGNIFYWMLRECDPIPVTREKNSINYTFESFKRAAEISLAHDKFNTDPNPVNNIAWAPQGNLLASCWTEVKYWTRSKPGAREERERNSIGFEDVFDESVVDGA